MLTAAWAAGADNDEYARLARKNSLAQAQLLAHLRDHVEDSGITLRQLRQLREQIYRRCVPEGWTSAFSKQKLTPESVTLYDVMEWYIKPETKPNTCSYIELLVAQVDPRAAPVRSQQPVWFVSHWRTSDRHCGRGGGRQPPSAFGSLSVSAHGHEAGHDCRYEHACCFAVSFSASQQAEGDVVLLGAQSASVGNGAQKPVRT